MNKRLLLSLVIVALAPMVMAASCGISNNPLQDIAATANQNKDDVLAKLVITGIHNASWNFDQAVAVGALSKTDPAPGCLHSVMTDLGIDPANPPAPGSSFTPRVTDVISLGSVLYIRAQQLQGLQGQGIQVPTDCKALAGTITLDGLRAAVKGLPGGGNLIPLK